MKTKFLISLFLLVGLYSQAQVGMNCQYVPGIQFGTVKVKTNNAALGSEYKFKAGLPILMIDRVTNHWYTNLDFSSLYYAATATNKAADNQIKIAKSEGAYAAGRLGYLFGKGDQFRIGANINLGFSTSNLDSLKKPLDNRGYTNFGGGLIVYKKIGKKMRFVGKVGYEKIAAKSFITKAHGFYVETTLGYSIMQKYGLSIMPCYYSKSFDYTPKTANATANVLTNAKVSSFVIRVGLTKFF